MQTVAFAVFHHFSQNLYAGQPFITGLSVTDIHTLFHSPLQEEKHSVTVLKQQQANDEEDCQRVAAEIEKDKLQLVGFVILWLRLQRLPRSSDTSPFFSNSFSKSSKRTRQSRLPTFFLLYCILCPLMDLFDFLSNTSPLCTFPVSSERALQ